VGSSIDPKAAVVTDMSTVFNILNKKEFVVFPSRPLVMYLRFFDLNLHSLILGQQATVERVIRLLANVSVRPYVFNCFPFKVRWLQNIQHT
jgi:hypothetical protein